MSKTIVIALHGEPGAGKDAIGSHLVEKHGFTRLAFADRLKECCEALDPIVSYRASVDPTGSPVFELVRLTDAVAELGWDEAKRRYPEVRRTQRYLATEVIRDLVDPHYWVNYVQRQIEPDGRYVITDLRFPNEAAMVTAQRLWHPDNHSHHGEWTWWEPGEIWWVTRPNNPHAVAEEHVSEQWHPSVSRSIINDGDLFDLHGQVDFWIKGKIDA